LGLKKQTKMINSLTEQPRAVYSEKEDCPFCFKGIVNKEDKLSLHLWDLLAIQFAIKNLFASKDFTGITSSTPRIPHKIHSYHRTKAQVPDDGRWHMKYHRNRH
jgi:hypothetical protein